MAAVVRLPRHQVVGVGAVLLPVQVRISKEGHLFQSQFLLSAPCAPAPPPSSPGYASPQAVPPAAPTSECHSAPADCAPSPPQPTGAGGTYAQTQSAGAFVPPPQPEYAQGGGGYGPESLPPPDNYAPPPQTQPLDQPPAIQPPVQPPAPAPAPTPETYKTGNEGTEGTGSSSGGGGQQPSGGSTESGGSGTNSYRDPVGFRRLEEQSIPSLGECEWRQGRAQLVGQQTGEGHNNRNWKSQ